MVDITHKSNTLRQALAEAKIVVGSEDTIAAIKNGTVPKGDVFEMSRAAGLLGIKKTPELLPDCHPLPIEHAKVNYSIEGLTITISVFIKTIYKTGVEVEAMHGASVVALNIYDMLKPIDKQVHIGEIKLVEKRGGKSTFKKNYLDRPDIKAHVVVCSDMVAAGQKEDKAGKAVISALEKSNVTIDEYALINDEKSAIESAVEKAKVQNANLLIFTGGTGLSKRDITPDTLRPLLDKEIPGIEEAIRSYGQNRMPYAMVSRSVAGSIGGMLVLAIPGSTNGARESMDAIFPEVLHVFGVLKGKRH
ncbi:MAG: bifunctional molybdenum cofactor biosynthesis protein MoaC/MoaB [Crocinitomicaceae bacterium]|nr:bifunctional molybdenum cofactor biosynthesis protein MoaC/MoaB [Crocinitomicaceae bacterium]